jgi:uncharacterized protein
MEISSNKYLAVGIFLGIVIGSFILGSFLHEARKGERYVTVKGVSERDVKADLAVWPIKVGVVGNNLGEAGRTLESTRNKVVQFLKKNGFTDAEISNEDLRVLDRQAGHSSELTIKNMMRFVLDATVLVRTSKIDKVSQVSKMTDELVKTGVVLSSTNEWQGIGPKYLFSKLNEIKPGMMAEATKNARAAAAQFAQDSGSKVGSIRRASQGLFSISDRDQRSQVPNDVEGINSGISDPNKRVRVVVTVDYLLAN